MVCWAAPDGDIKWNVLEVSSCNTTCSWIFDFPSVEIFWAFCFYFKDLLESQNRKANSKPLVTFDVDVMVTYGEYILLLGHPRDSLTHHIQTALDFLILHILNHQHYFLQVLLLHWHACFRYNNNKRQRKKRDFLVTEFKEFKAAIYDNFSCLYTI